MKTPEQAAADYLDEYEKKGPAGVIGRRLDEYERRATPMREHLPDAIRTAWAAYNDPETPAEMREELHTALANMINSL